MKVAICIPMDLTAAGGVETSVLALAEALGQHGVETHVFAHNGANCRLLKQLDPGAYDIIHTQAAGLWPGLVTQLFNSRLRRRLVHTLQGVSLDYARACNAWLNWRVYTATMNEGILSRAAAHVIAVSDSVRRSSLRSFRLPESKVTTIPSGHNQEPIMPEQHKQARLHFGLQDDQRALLFVGRGEDRVKGTAAVTAAMQRLHQQDPSVRLLAAPGGGFADAAWLIRTGRLDHSQMHLCYGAADIFVNASLNEGMPLTLLEAMAAGLPVVAAPVGGIPEIVRHNENGLLTQPDRSDLFDCLHRLLQEPPLRKRLAQEAQVSTESLRWSDIAERNIQIYQCVLGIPER